MCESQNLLSLQCGHVYHTACIDTYAAVKEVNIADLQCKETSHDLRARESATIVQDIEDGDESTVGDDIGDGRSGTEVAQNGSGAPAETLPHEDAGDLDNAASDDEPKGDDLGHAASAPAQPAAPMPPLVRAASEGFQISAVPAWNENDESLICCDCGHTCTKFRVHSKGKGTARCNKCSYVLTRLYRAKGPGNMEDLARLPEEEKIAFFRASHEPMSTKAQKALYDKAVEQYCTRERVFELGGEFKPLGVWGTLGYDIKIIAEQSLPHDIMAHRMWGFVYRVPLLYVGDRGANGTRSSDAVHAVHSAPRPKRLRALPAEGVVEDEMVDAAVEDEMVDAAEPVVEDDTSDDSTSSSTSSSSSSGKKKKKKKKSNARSESRKAAKKEKKRMAKEKKAARKEKERQKKQAREEREKKRNAEKEARAAEKEQEKEARAAEQAEKKAHNKGTAIAKSSCKRIEAAISSIQKTMRLPGAAKIPDAQKNPLREILAALEALLLEVQPVATGRDFAAGFTAPQQEKTLLEKAKKHQALFVVAAKTYNQ